MDFQGKRVLVLGLGVHGGGVGVARFLAKRGAQVTVADQKSADELKDSMQALEGLSVAYHLGEHTEADVLNSEMVIRNPAVPRDHPLLLLAQSKGIPVEMEIGLFFQLCPAPIIGITGTKGKTTTTLLAGAMLKEKDPRTVVAGNLRVSALDLLDQIDATTPVVLELSSWQCEGLQAHQTSAHIAAITNLYADHLNRYVDMTDYASAKALIYKYQKPGDAVILNADQKASRDFAALAPAETLWFSRTQRIDGVCLGGDQIIQQQGDSVMPIAERGDLKLIGDHNLENALAATAVALRAGVSPAQIKTALQKFEGVPHRMELVRELNGVRYINDTTSTAPAATIAALKAIGSNIILIAGGANKGLDFEAMGRSAALRCKWILLLDGDAYYQLDAMLRYGGGGAKIVDRFYSMADAVYKAYDLARPGDTVLLSPGCASFGMFKNEFDRGDEFRELVLAL